MACIVTKNARERADAKKMKMSPRYVTKFKGLLVYLFMLFAGADGQTCKTLLHPWINTGLRNGVCYYGLSTTKLWSEAASMCEQQGLHLVFLQTSAQQREVYGALGSSFGQHWVGLRYLSGAWRWYYNSSYNVIATGDVNGRWEGSTTGYAAYTTTSSNMDRLKVGDTNMRYRPVCEDIPASSTSSVPATTTTPKVTDCGLFEKRTSLTTAQYLTYFRSTLLQACALHCLGTSGCRHFVFLSAANNCSVYEEKILPTTVLPACNDDNYCYSSIC